jgi:hypothetical protein
MNIWMRYLKFYAINLLTRVIHIRFLNILPYLTESYQARHDLIASKSLPPRDKNNDRSVSIIFYAHIALLL